MGRWKIAVLARIAICLILPSQTHGEEFKHVGDYLLKSHCKITGDKVTPIPIKSMAFRVFTDGIKVRVVTEGEEESRTTFDIYRSDGVGRQRGRGGALEVVPGLQAMSHTGGVVRHLRMSKDSMTITTFPAVSDQTIVSHSVAATPKTEAEKSKPPMTAPTQGDDKKSPVKP